MDFDDLIVVGPWEGQIWVETTSGEEIARTASTGDDAIDREALRAIAEQSGAVWA